MKDDFILKNKEFFYLAFIIIALITFYPLFFTGFATADDFNYYMVTRRGIGLTSASWFAITAGRFYFYLVQPFYNLPYFCDNMVVIKMFHYVPLIFCFLLFAKIVFATTKSKELAWFFLLTFLMTMQISEHYNLFVAYPFYFTFSFSLLLISYLLLLRYYQQKKTSLIIYASLFFAFGLLFYETYILFLSFFVATIVYYNLQDKKSLWQTVKGSFLQFLPFLIVGIIYLAAYFIFRIYFPSQYPGTKFGFKDVTAGTFFTVLWNLSSSAFPLNVYEASHGLFADKSDLVNGYYPIILNLILSARVEWIVKGILVSFVGYKLLMALPSLGPKRILGGISLSILMIFLPHVPLALTEKYTFFAGHSDSNMVGYVTTFFSFFGTTLLIILLMGPLINLFNFRRFVKRAVAIIFVVGFFICSVLTDFSNYTIAKDMRSSNIRLYAIDELLKTDEFKAIPAGTPIFAKDLWENPSYAAHGITEQGFNWYSYFQVRNGVTYQVWRDNGLFLQYSKKVQLAPYSLTMRQAEKTEDLSLVLARMVKPQQDDSVVNQFADRATILYYSPYKTFTFSFRIKTGFPPTNSPIKINSDFIEVEEVVNRTIEVTIYNTKKWQPASVFSVQFPGIDLNSIMISNMVNPRNKWYYL